jgi:hypothetical protein
MKLWKALGLAGLAGVAATGAIIARDQRQRAQLSPEQVRERLHRRVEEADLAGAADQDPTHGSVEGPDQGPAHNRDSTARA